MREGGGRVAWWFGEESKEKWQTKIQNRNDRKYVYGWAWRFKEGMEVVLREVKGEGGCGGDGVG